MFSGERRLSGEPIPPSTAALAVASPGLVAQERSWFGLPTGLSRAAASFMQRHLAGRQGPRAEPPYTGLEGHLEDVAILQQAEKLMLAQGRCRLTVESLRELGIQDSDETDSHLCQPSQSGYLSTAISFLGQVWLSAGSSQENRQDLRTSGCQSRAPSPGWWDNLWGGEESTVGPLIAGLCPQQPAAVTKVLTVQTNGAIVPSRVWTLRETSRRMEHKDRPGCDQNLHTTAAQGCTEEHEHSETPRTPDQDNGYASLEEEHAHIPHLSGMRTSCDDQLQQLIEQEEGHGAANPGGESETPVTEEDDGEEPSGRGEYRNDEEEEETVAQGSLSTTPPRCQNKSIAFIMGCPISDEEDDSLSERDSSDDDDDGFDSEGLSDWEEDDDDSSEWDGEVEEEAEHLWTLLCQSRDPYNPQNFTATLQTGSRTEPRIIPQAQALAQSSPESSPDPLPLAALPPSSPLSQDSWDDSASASEVDEAESLRLWRSFSSSSDPYSPFNFQASLGPRGGPSKSKRSPPPPAFPLLQHNQASSPPRDRRAEAEERLDSGFLEPPANQGCPPTHSGPTAKKVHFCEEVEEFFASCGEEEEDRHGPWEELARDRCRFLRRCQEVEQSIAYCLQPQHRSLVYQRLFVSHGQDS